MSVVVVWLCSPRWDWLLVFLLQRLSIGLGRTGRKPAERRKGDDLYFYRENEREEEDIYSAKGKFLLIAPRLRDNAWSR
jgi:hypothetical protein